MNTEKNVEGKDSLSKGREIQKANKHEIRSN